MTKIVALSDTHSYHHRVTVPDGDILIHAGDFSFDEKNNSNHVAFAEFLQWYESQPHEHKILVAGNHDQLFESNPSNALALLEKYAPSVTYLEDAEVNVEGFTIWGSPMTPSFFDWSFNRDRGPAIKAHWDKIPDNIDILVTHGPPIGILDKNPGWDGERSGCKDLLEAVERTKPLLHIFGHVHGGYGTLKVNRPDASTTIFCNVSVCNHHYHPVNRVTVIDL